MARVETPAYEVVELADGGIERRRYAPMVVAETDVPGDRDAAASAGFRILADYIFGNNRSKTKIAMTAPVEQAPAAKAPSEKIAMTAPVEQAPAAGGGWTIRFILPPEYTLESAPEPLDPRVRLARMEARSAVAVRFSGRWTKASLESRKAELDAFAAARGLTPDGAAVYAFYDGPFTPFFMRRNEVIYYLKDGV